MDLLKEFEEFYKDLQTFAEDEITKHKKYIYDKLKEEFCVEAKTLDKIKEVLKGDVANKLTVIEKILKDV